MVLVSLQKGVALSNTNRFAMRKVFTGIATARENNQISILVQGVRILDTRSNNTAHPIINKLINSLYLLPPQQVQQFNPTRQCSILNLRSRVINSWQCRKEFYQQLFEQQLQWRVRDTNATFVFLWRQANWTLINSLFQQNFLYWWLRNSFAFSSPQLSCWDLWIWMW